jgi:hypothetical protein
MEDSLQRGGTSLMVPKTPIRQRVSENILLDECRSLARVLAKKIEILNRECPSEREKSMHIRTMGLTLATLTALVNTPDKDFPATRTSDIVEDARGFTYKSVRYCDLERICDK